MKSLLLLFLMAASAAFAAPTYNSDQVNFTDAAPGAGTISHNFTSSGSSNSIIFAVVNYEVSNAWTATYNGAAMSVASAEVGSSNAFQKIFYITGFSAGSHATVFTPSPGYFSGPVSTMIFSYDGASTTLGTVASGTAAPTSTNNFLISWSITPSSASSQILEVASLTAGGCGSQTWTITTSLGTSRLATAIVQNNQKAMGFADGASPGTGATTINLTFTASPGCSSSSNMVATGIEILAAGGGGTATSTTTPTTTPTATPTPVAGTDNRRRSGHSELILPIPTVTPEPPRASAPYDIPSFWSLLAVLDRTSSMAIWKRDIP